MCKAYKSFTLLRLKPMNKVLTLYSVLLALLLSSCTQWKALTSRDNSGGIGPSRKSHAKDVRFLENISVTPGQVVTSNHKTPGSSVASSARRRKQRDDYNGFTRLSAASGNIEKADWLQLKYAIVLDATVETLTNVSLLSLIDDWWGTDYCLGGSSKNCIDCSAFSHLVLLNVYNTNIPRTAQEQYNASQHIGMEDLNEGDLVFFHTGGRDISHVGVYLQNNKFVHAATSGGVMVSDLNDSYWKGRFKGAGRYVAHTAAR